MVIHTTYRRRARARRFDTRQVAAAPELTMWSPSRRGGGHAIFFAVILGVGVAVTCSLAATPNRAAPRLDREKAFLAENEAAMNRMMSGMAVRSTGDADADFAAVMIPHHQGAIDMAVAELRYGKNEQLRRIAQEIIVDQQQEIMAMRLALGQKLPPPAAAPTQSPMKM